MLARLDLWFVNDDNYSDLVSETFRIKDLIV